MLSYKIIFIKVDDLHHIINFMIISFYFKDAFDLLDSSPSFDLITLNNNIDKPLEKYRTSNNKLGIFCKRS